MPKRNSEKLMEQSLYDFLCFMNANIRTYPSELCVMIALGEKNRDDRCKKHEADCGKCLQSWMNEETPF